MTHPARQQPLAGLADLPTQTDEADTLREEITRIIAGSGRRKEIAYALFGEKSPSQRLTHALLGEETFFDVDHVVPALRRCSVEARVEFVETLLRLLDLGVNGSRVVPRTTATVEERLAALEASRRETARRLEREASEEASIRADVRGGKR